MAQYPKFQTLNMVITHLLPGSYSVADGRRRLGYDSCKPKDTSSATGSLASFAALLGVTVVVALLLV